jgi:hypothetical protein
LVSHKIWDSIEISNISELCFHTLTHFQLSLTFSEYLLVSLSYRSKFWIFWHIYTLEIMLDKIIVHAPYEHTLMQTTISIWFNSRQIGCRIFGFLVFLGSLRMNGDFGQILQSVSLWTSKWVQAIGISEFGSVWKIHYVYNNESKWLIDLNLVLFQLFIMYIREYQLGNQYGRHLSIILAN